MRSDAAQSPTFSEKTESILPLSLFDPRSGYQVFGCIPQCSRARRHSSHSTAATITQSERFRKAVRAFNQRGVFEPDDLLGTGVDPAHSPAIHGALPLRAQSSGPGQPTSAARTRHCSTPSSRSTPSAPRRNAQLPLSGRSLMNVDGILDNYSPAVSARYVDQSAMTLTISFNARKSSGLRV